MKRKKTVRKKRKLHLPDDVKIYNKKLDKKIEKVSGDFRERVKMPSKVTRLPVSKEPVKAVQTATRSKKKTVLKKEKSGKKPAKMPTLIHVSIGRKHAMEILSETIASLGHQPVELNLWMKDPVSAFLIAMYDEISTWPEKTLVQFISTLTKEVPKKIVPEMLGTAKRLFHEMFANKKPDPSEIISYDSVWKLWPHVREKERGMSAKKKAKSKKTSVKSVAQAPKEQKVAGTKKAIKKKTASSKKTPSKKTLTKKKTSKKKTSTKKTVAKKKSSSASLGMSTKIVALKGASTDKKVRQRVLAAIGKKGTTVEEAMRAARCPELTIKMMIKKGLIAVA